MPASRPLLACCAALALAAALAACGSAADPGASGANASSASRGEDALKFSKCMREHGVKNFPNPEVAEGRVTLRVHPGPGGVEAPRQTLEAAQNACKRFIEASAPKLTPQQRVEQEEAIQKFARCMREHGIHLEAHTSSGGNFAIGIKGGPSGGPNPASPAFQAAQKTCQALVPKLGLKGGPGPAPAPGSPPKEGSGAPLSTGG